MLDTRHAGARRWSTLSMTVIAHPRQATRRLYRRRSGRQKSVGGGVSP
ncbi:hypothetical protein HMPREF0063_11422 [Aeromicrobium marinum DSM 15272]|uniref:Uncharacterized protein n=1 Tax=Aeromicrobium marinum DSM 15272 TaxID=585531 RepID=E2SBL3_9ACTN|nr:hypothetical protein HMPREF0063_11422 [Aeromicrobium marinum DSM 15272]